MSNIELNCLESIVNYCSDSMEARACKLVFLYIQFVNSVFPLQKLNYPRKDPRKSFIFKVCYKLLKETQHKLKDSEYPLYVKAQLDIIKSVTSKVNKTPHISPSCLVGEKAWARWCVWKKIYDAKLAQRSKSIEEAGVDPHSYDRIKTALDKDKAFLLQKFGKISKEKVQKSINDRVMLRWIATSQLSAYYALLNSILHQWLNDRKISLEDMFQIDFKFYQQGITKEIEKYFNDSFYNE